MTYRKAAKKTRESYSIRPERGVKERLERVSSGAQVCGQELCGCGWLDKEKQDRDPCRVGAQRS